MKTPHHHTDAFDVKEFLRTFEPLYAVALWCRLTKPPMPDCYVGPDGECYTHLTPGVIYPVEQADAVLEGAVQRWKTFSADFGLVLADPIAVQKDFDRWKAKREAGRRKRDRAKERASYEAAKACSLRCLADWAAQRRWPACLDEEEKFDQDHPYSSKPPEEDHNFYAEYDGCAEEGDQGFYALTIRYWWRHGMRIGTACPLAAVEDLQSFSTAELAALTRLSIHEVEGLRQRWNLLGWIMDDGHCRWSKSAYFGRLRYEGSFWPPPSIAERMEDETRVLVWRLLVQHAKATHMPMSKFLALMADIKGLGREKLVQIRPVLDEQARIGTPVDISALLAGLERSEP